MNIERLKKIFSACPQVVAVYLFGSYLEDPQVARDVDLAVLLKPPAGSTTELYFSLYPELSRLFGPREVDLLVLNLAPLPLAFEIISTGKVIYCADEEARTDFEYMTTGLYHDYRYHLRKAQQELFEAIKEGSFLV
ncbi:type VII toxin-antitoxin system MntA family adenylyltransferase antitoxin [Desulfovirgula thermocuniculi]|uniref:type VII toxin-antitoxin system MntA family adenylyltransferase antitoxin n=1 Tax=Desulfovirgula thermocuniculi TaxID=348842 RepID=UPI0003F681AF|nr:nucleotidyltransferase domain-containing protein [Desulfovirgula thermocuniculi]